MAGSAANFILASVILVSIFCIILVVSWIWLFFKTIFLKSSKLGRVGQFIWTGTPLVLACVLGFAFFVLPEKADAKLNGVFPGLPPKPTLEAQKLHRTLTVVDMHADSLLWTHRNLLLRSSVGHVDLERLIEGNVAIQAFTLVTKSPFGQNNERNGNRTDAIALVGAISRWPLNTIAGEGTAVRRAVMMSKQLHLLSQRSGGALRVVKTASELRAFVAARAAATTAQDAAAASAAASTVDGEAPAMAMPRVRMVAGFLGLEGLHCASRAACLRAIDTLFGAGVRMMALTHFSDTLLGGSAHGEEKYGLTALGRDAVARMEALRVLVDLAHASPALVADVIAVATRPLVVSHTGVRGTCPGPRNLGDDAVRAIAAGGGLVSIAYFPAAVCGNDTAAIVRAIRYTAEVVGGDTAHIGLGSDFDGTVHTPFDTSQLASLTSQLLKASSEGGGGFTPTQVAGIMGGNAVRVLSTLLPP